MMAMHISIYFLENWTVIRLALKAIQSIYSFYEAPRERIILKYCRHCLEELWKTFNLGTILSPSIYFLSALAPATGCFPTQSLGLFCRSSGSQQKWLWCPRQGTKGLWWERAVVGEKLQERKQCFHANTSLEIRKRGREIQEDKAAELSLNSVFSVFREASVDFWVYPNACVVSYYPILGML